MAAPRTLLSILSAFFALSGCASESRSGANEEDSQPAAVEVDVRSPAARAQYEANVAFAARYKPRCTGGSSGRPRVLLTGFGRFLSVRNNVSGRLISALAPQAAYPESAGGGSDSVESAESQLSVGKTVLTLKNAVAVEVCAMILPVYWDLAAILVAKELDAFKPSFVMMNGSHSQGLAIELGSTNRASTEVDASNEVRPIAGAKLIPNATSDEESQANLLSWSAVVSAARAAIERHGNDRAGSTTFRALVPELKLASFPRQAASDHYICNNMAYVTGYLMSHPRTPVSLLQAVPADTGRESEVRVELKADFRNVPRVFVHWPAEMADTHVGAGADIMTAIIDAQMAALAKGDRPKPGDNALASR